MRPMKAAPGSRSASYLLYPLASHPGSLLMGREGPAWPAAPALSPSDVAGGRCAE